MKTYVILCVGLCFSLLVESQWAAMADPNFQPGSPMMPGGLDLNNKSSAVPEPSQIPPPLPEKPAPVAAKPVVKSSIPPLPVSVPCTPQDVIGLWKLEHIYEEPIGNETYAFEVSPVQYVNYVANGLYGRYSGSIVMPPKLVVNEINKHSTGLQQYLVQDTGVMYYYQDKVANDEQSCFFVAKDSAPFFKGNMLQMPPKGKIAGRLIKHYVRVGGPPQQRGGNNRPQRPAPNQRRASPDASGQVVLPTPAINEHSGELYRPPDPNNPRVEAPAQLDDIVSQ
jgi:hypothetical protein